MDDTNTHESSTGSALPARKLGKTSVSASVLTLGTWGLAEAAYGPTDEGSLERVVRAALERGVRSFDVAPLWGDGLAETVVGEAIAAQRDDCVVITRAGAVRKGDGIVRAYDAASLRGSIDSSRRRLGTDYVDVLLLHEPPEKALVDGSFAKGLATLEVSSAIRTWGISTTSIEAARIAMSFGAKVICVPHHLLAPDVLAGITEDADAFGAGVLVRSPLAHGLLSQAGIDRSGFEPEDHRRLRWSASALDARKRQASGFSAVWTQKAPSLAAFALRYALTNPVVGSAIVGPRSEAQLDELIAAVAETQRLDPMLVEKTAQIAAVLGV